MSALTGQTKASTYDSLLHITDNGPADGTLKAVADGVGNDTALQVSTAAVHSAGTLSSVSADGTNSARFAGASGAARIYGYFDATLGTTVNALNVAGDTYIPLSLDGSTVRCMASGNLVGLFTATGLNATAIGETTPAAGRFTFAKQSVGNVRLASDFVKTADTALANVTGLSVSLAAGETYSFSALLICSQTGAGDYKIGLSGTATITDLRWVNNFLNGSGSYNDNFTTFTSGGYTGSTGTARIDGTITVNGAGTLTVQFAQNAAAATSTVRRGSYLHVTQY